MGSFFPLLLGAQQLEILKGEEQLRGSNKD